MGKVSFMSIVKEYIEEKGLNDDDKVDAYFRKSYRYLEDFIEKLGGNIDDMKSANNRIEFDESEIPSIKYLLRQFLASDKNTIKNFIKSKDHNYSVDEINKFVDQFTNEYCTPEDKCAKVHLVEYMSNIFMLSHMRLIEECHASFDESYGELKYKIYMYDDELEMIKQIFKMINTLKRDFVLIWNLSFDIPYFMDRLTYLGKDPIDYMCSPDFKYKYCWFRKDRRNFDFKTKKDVFRLASYSIFSDQMINYARNCVVDNYTTSNRINNVNLYIDFIKFYR